MAGAYRVPARATSETEAVGPGTFRDATLIPEPTVEAVKDAEIGAEAGADAGAGADAEAEAKPRRETADWIWRAREDSIVMDSSVDGGVDGGEGEIEQRQDMDNEADG